MDLAELRNYDISDLSRLGTAPPAVKALVAGLLLLAILGAGYYFHVRHQLEALRDVQAEEARLKARFEKKYQQAANLEAYKAQLAEMQREFGAMLRQLPSETEIPGVILDVSQTGLASGLKILLFKPQEEIDKGFYAEKPIKIKVRGTFDQMAHFSSGIAALPRIVTLHDITLIPDKDGKELTMEVTAKTYRYKADEDREAEQALRHKRRKGRRGRDE